MDTSIQKVFLVACAVLPLFSTFLLSCSSRFNFDQKYGTLLSMAKRIMGEIYKYRTRSGIYQPRSRNEGLDNILNDAKDGGNANRGHAGEYVSSRKIFSEQVTNMYERAMTVLTTSSMSETPRDFMLEKTAMLVSKHCHQEKQHVQECEKHHPLVDVEIGSRSSLEVVLQEEVEDDGMSFLTAEDYVLMRVTPNINRLQLILPRLNFWFSFFQILVLSSTLTSGVLAFLGLKEYIPIAAAFASTAQSLGSHENLHDRLTASNGALSELQALLVWYKGLSMVERRLAHNKSHLVDVTETALIAELAVLSLGGDAKPILADQDTDKDTEKGKGKKIA